MQISTSKLFASGSLTGVFCTLVSYVRPGNQSTLDIHLHDTYAIIAHAHIILLCALLLGFFALIYSLFPRLFKRRMNPVAGAIHFVLTVAAMIAMFWPRHYEGIACRPRRYYDYSAHNQLFEFAALNKCVSIFMALALLAQIIFLLNLVLSAFLGAKIRNS